MYKKKPRVGVEARIEGVGREGVECAWEAGLEHCVGEIVHEVLDSRAGIAGDMWSMARTKLKETGREGGSGGVDV